MFQYGSIKDKEKLSIRMQRAIMDKGGRATSYHKDLEQHPFLLHNILNSKSFTLEAYRDYLVQLQAIYCLLEQRLIQDQKDPSIAPLFALNFFQSLFRAGELNKDIALIDAQLGSERSRELLAPTEEYLRRLREESSERLIGHVYARYFGDLSGLQIIRNNLQRLLAAKHCGDATHFFDVRLTEQDTRVSTATMETMKDKMRECFNKIDGKHHGNIIDEVTQSFRLLYEMFGALNTKHYPEANKLPAVSKWQALADNSRARMAMMAMVCLLVVVSVYTLLCQGAEKIAQRQLQFN